MIAELVIMAVSALVMAGLLVHKHLETSRGIHSPVLSMREKTDPMLLGAHKTTGAIVSQFTFHNLVLALNHAIVHIVRFFMRITTKVHGISSGIVEKASKKTEDLSKGGAASFYLKQIKDAKDNGTRPK